MPVMRRPMLYVYALATAILLAMPIAASAQEATVTGTITDSTGGVLPGVTVTATNEESGNTFIAVTDGAGAFRLPLRIGSYQISAELAGVGPAARSGLPMEGNQRGPLKMQPAPPSPQEAGQVT